MGNQLGMATGTGVARNSQQSVSFEGEPDVPNCKTCNWNICYCRLHRYMCISTDVYAYLFMFN